MAFNLNAGERAQRKLLITVAEWADENGRITIDSVKYSREILGTRTEDSSIEFNADMETMTDVRGITYTDINKTEPSQTFDPYYIIGGTDYLLGEYLSTAALKNDINAYNGKFTVYIISAYIGAAGAYHCVKHTGCTILPTSLGGDSFVAMPIEVHLSNNLVEGTVDKLAADFVFTEQ